MGHYNRLKTNKNEVIMQAAAYIIQPKFSISKELKRVPVHDLALIKLARPVPLSHSIGAACLPLRSDKLPDGALAFTAGWGLVSPNSSAVNEPRKTPIQIAAFRSCPELMVDRNLHVCARNNRGENICEGDGGSGLMVRAKVESNNQTNNGWKWHVFGVASYGVAECSKAVNHNNAFASVVTDVDWIHQMIQKY